MPEWICYLAPGEFQQDAFTIINLAEQEGRVRILTSVARQGTLSACRQLPSNGEAITIVCVA